VLVNVAFYSAFPERVEEIAGIVAAGAVGFKVYLSKRIGGLDVDDDEMLLAAFRAASAKGIPVAVHAEDRKILEEERIKLKKAGKSDVGAYVKAHPPEAELQSIQRIIELVKKSSTQVHFCHVSSALGLKAILIAKRSGLPLTCEVTPHHLLLSSEQYKRSGFFALTDPPLRKRGDISFLWDALYEGSINTIASDHAPHALKEKAVRSVWNVSPGIPGLETNLSLLLTQVNEGRLSFTTLVKLTANEPARIFHLRGRGSLEEGNWADVVVVDMKRKYVIDSSAFFSKARYSPFDGVRVRGRAVKTLVNGQLVMDDGAIVPEGGCGEVIGF
jgi:dihydroorotase